MVQNANKILANVPLLVKVICLYGLLSIGYIFSQPSTQQTGIDNSQYLSSVPAIDVSQTENDSSDLIVGVPTRLRIPRLGIDLVIQEGAYIEAEQEWELSDDTAHYANNTYKANNKRGNTLIYGHNTDEVLRGTKDIQNNEVLLIETDTGHTFRYIYTEDLLVEPTNTTIFEEQYDTPHVTLLTCDGLWDQHRRIMTFKLEAVI